MSARIFKTALTALAFAFASAGTYSAADEPDKRSEPIIERGKEAFRSYCSACHGVRGGGDGPIAEVLKTPPADLTQLKNKYNGEFPKAKLEKIIDGREPLLTKVHGVREMPVWGERLALEVGGSMGKKEEHVRKKIALILRYVESIQAPPASVPTN